MNTLVKNALPILFSVFLFQPVNAQKLLKNIADKAKEKVEQKVEERAERKLDEKIDQGLDKVEGSLDKKDTATENGENQSANPREAKAQQRMQGMLKGMGISDEPVPVADNYSFDHLIQMHIESADKNGKKTSDGEFITHLNPKSKSMAYEVVSGDMAQPGQGMFIVDAENNAIIILSDENGKKTGLVYGIQSFLQTTGGTFDETTLEETPEMYLANPNVEKTGRSKTIAGYKCDEFVYSDEESKSNIWITQDLKMNTQDFFSTLFKTSLYSRGFPWGYLMESTSLDKQTGDTSTMTVTKVETNSNKKFSMADYQVTNLGSFTMPDQK